MCVRHYVHSCNIAILCEDFFSLLVLYVGISCQYCLGECLVQIKTLTLCRRCQIKLKRKNLKGQVNGIVKLKLYAKFNLCRVVYTHMEEVNINRCVYM